jgi:Spx/MgsR family transcriptional regulator
MITLYGINNCDTVRKARKWLEKNKIEFTFYDFKKQPLTAKILTSFVEQSEWSLLLNKRSTTFKQLSDDIKSNLTDQVMFDTVLAHPTLLKRPLLSLGEHLHLGFKEAHYQELF